MLALVFGALRARRGQTIALFALTLLAALGCATAPWFLSWARAAVERADIASAPATQRTVMVSATARYSPGVASPLAELRTVVAENLPGLEPVAGARLYASLGRAGTEPSIGAYLAYRDALCAQLVIEGTCLTRPKDALISRSAAEQIGVGLGDEVAVKGFRLPGTTTLRVGGIYTVVDRSADYWAGTDLLSGPSADAAVAHDALFVSEETLLALKPTGFEVDVHVTVPEDALREDGFEAMFTSATNYFRRIGAVTRSEVPTLLAQMRLDRRLLESGVIVATVELLVLCWFALFLALRHTADERRFDIGLLKLRGAKRWRIWFLTVQQTALPMLAGALAGWLVGPVCTALLAADAASVVDSVHADPLGTVGLSAVAVAVALVGALVFGVLAERRALGAPVAELMRRVPPRRRRWRAELVDVVVVLVAAAGVFQGYAELRSDGKVSYFALLAPSLVGLAFALVAARALPAVAARSGAAALRTGRVGAALAALHLARRRGTQRVFAAIAAAVSLFATSIFFWHTATVGWADRARTELGAERVLSVHAPSSTALLSAVRAVDPVGHYAMAVARTGVGTLAVDSAALARVAATAFPDSAGLAAALRPAAPEPVRLVDGPVTLEAKGPTSRPDLPVQVRLHLSTQDGATTTVDFGPIGPARRTYGARVTGCREPCRLVAVEPVAPGRIASQQETTVELYRLAQADGEVVGPTQFADVGRWRTHLDESIVGPLLVARDGRLEVSLHTGPVAGGLPDGRAFVVDTPIPLPVALAGAPLSWVDSRDERVPLLSADMVPYRVVGTVPLVPRLGGDGVLMDLEYAQRSSSLSTESAALEVWLSPDAPEDVVDRLAEHGIEVEADTDVAGVVDRLSRHGPGMALRFELFGAAVVLLLAAATVAVTAAVERRERASELFALRAQGLSAQSVRIAGYASTGLLVVAAVVTGLFAALVARIVVKTSMPVFTDSWSLLPLRTGAEPVPLAISAALALVVLGVAAGVASSRVARAVDRRQ